MRIFLVITKPFYVNLTYTICVSLAACEIRFSKLKLINNCLRSTMGQIILASLAILSILLKHKC